MRKKRREEEATKNAKDYNKKVNTNMIEEIKRVTQSKGKGKEKRRKEEKRNK